MMAAVFSRSLVVFVCDENGREPRNVEEGLTSMGFSVIRYSDCDQALQYPPSKVGDVHLVIASCSFSRGPTGTEAVETLYRHFLGVPMALLGDAADDAADRLGSAYSFFVLRRPVDLEQLARAAVMAHFNRAP